MFASQMISTAVSCNLSCTYCYYVTGASEYVASNLQADDYEAWFEKCRSADVPLYSIDITGGEPLLHPGIEGILRVAADAFHRYALLTNGVLMTDTIAHLLASLGYSVHVSLDHVSPEVGDRVRGGTKGALRGIERLLEAGVREIEAAMVVTSQNWRDIPNVSQFAADKGVALELLPVGIHSSHHLSLTRLAPEERIALATMVRDVQADREDYSLNVASAVLTGRLPRIERCSFVESSIFIEADGGIWPCGHGMGPTQRLGSILDDPTEIVLKHAEAASERRPPTCAGIHCLPLAS